MKRQKPSPKKTQATESFLAVPQKLGNALADTIEHPNCPGSVADAICELDTQIFNRCNDLEISLRHSFPYRLVGMFERPA